MQTFGWKQKFSCAFPDSTLSTDVWSRSCRSNFFTVQWRLCVWPPLPFFLAFMFVHFVYLDFAAWIHFSEFGLLWNYMPEPRDVVIWWTLTSIFYTPDSAHFVRHGLQTLSCKDFVRSGPLVKGKFPDPCSTLWGAEVEQRSTFATRRCDQLWVRFWFVNYFGSCGRTQILSGVENPKSTFRAEGETLWKLSWRLDFVQQNHPDFSLQRDHSGLSATFNLWKVFCKV